MNLMELKGVCKSYRRGGLLGQRDRFEVLKQIDLTLETGTCVGLLGRSGSGKSTMGRIMLDLEKPDQGEVLYENKALNSLGKEDYKRYRRNVQVVFQNPLGSVNPRFTAAQIIAEPLENFENLSPEKLGLKVEELLEKVGLPGSASNKYPLQFSGGELQRICIARAIALQPKLIILDEAISSLDMLIQARIVDLLGHLQQELGMTYLFISHDIRVLLKMSDRLLVMHEGFLVENTDDVKNLEQLTHESSRHLLKAILPPLPISTQENCGKILVKE